MHDAQSTAAITGQPISKAQIRSLAQSNDQIYLAPMPGTHPKPGQDAGCS